MFNKAPKVSVIISALTWMASLQTTEQSGMPHANSMPHMIVMCASSQLLQATKTQVAEILDIKGIKLLHTKEAVL